MSRASMVNLINVLYDRSFLSVRAPVDSQFSWNDHTVMPVLYYTLRVYAKKTVASTSGLWKSSESSYFVQQRVSRHENLMHTNLTNVTFSGSVCTPRKSSSIVCTVHTMCRMYGLLEYSEYTDTWYWITSTG